MVQPGIDVVLFVNDKPVAGQQNASLNRSMSPIEITNKINGEWKDSIAGLRSWKLQCGGMYVVSAEALTAIDDAFMNNEEVSVSLSVGEQKYFGKALITDFPINAVYQSQFKYTLSLLGVGELQRES